ncbi:hypothetical protein ALIPUT_01034 [Alistipes putredinis DSM 17216]|uniref:Uncharacterized protein n=1 Tax=Alistipes putredinis DSM 17216 TaxID=445970 RepID=B0MVF3_9BACT|nr:hypothetical protein ALIPUT_01034 [Alistipes putredinis DSM 17216]
MSFLHRILSTELCRRARIGFPQQYNLAAMTNSVVAALFWLI